MSKNKPSTGKRISVHPANANTPASVDLLILYRKAQMRGTPLKESGPVAYLRTEDYTETNQNYWYAKMMDIVFFSDNIDGIHFHNQAGYKTRMSIPKDFAVKNEKGMEVAEVAPVIRYSICKEHWNKALFDTVWDASRWDAGAGIGYEANDVIGYGSDVFFIINPQRYLNGRTMKQFASALLAAIFEEGAFYDFRPQCRLEASPLATCNDGGGK